MDLKMKKIPVKIVQYTMSGQIRKNVMLDIFDAYEMEGDVEKKINDFKKRYFEIVNDAEKLFFGKDLKKTKKRRSLSSSVYWKLGNMFRKFNKETKNEFIITNYPHALERDFGLSSRYVNELITFSTLFKKSEVLDSIPMAIYRALVWKKIQLEECGMLEKEKTRLLKMGKSKEFIGRENYKTELNKIIERKTSQKKSQKLS